MGRKRKQMNVQSLSQDLPAGEDKHLENREHKKRKTSSQQSVSQPTRRSERVIERLAQIKELVKRLPPHEQPRSEAKCRAGNDQITSKSTNCQEKSKTPETTVTTSLDSDCYRSKSQQDNQHVAGIENEEQSPISSSDEKRPCNLKLGIQQLASSTPDRKSYQTLPSDEPPRSEAECPAGNDQITSKSTDCQEKSKTPETTVTTSLESDCYRSKSQQDNQHVAGIENEEQNPISSSDEKRPCNLNLVIQQLASSTPDDHRRRKSCQTLHYGTHGSKPAPVTTKDLFEMLEDTTWEKYDRWRKYVKLLQFDCDSKYKLQDSAHIMCVPTVQDPEIFQWITAPNDSNSNEKSSILIVLFNVLDHVVLLVIDTEKKRTRVYDSYESRYARGWEYEIITTDAESDETMTMDQIRKLPKDKIILSRYSFLHLVKTTALPHLIAHTGHDSTEYEVLFAHDMPQQPDGQEGKSYCGIILAKTTAMILKFGPEARLCFDTTNDLKFLKFDWVRDVMKTFPDYVPLTHFNLKEMMSTLYTVHTISEKGLDSKTSKSSKWTAIKDKNFLVQLEHPGTETIRPTTRRLLELDVESMGGIPAEFMEAIFQLFRNQYSTKEIQLLHPTYLQEDVVAEDGITSRWSTSKTNGEKMERIEEFVIDYSRKSLLACKSQHGWIVLYIEYRADDSSTNLTRPVQRIEVFLPYQASENSIERLKSNLENQILPSLGTQSPEFEGERISTVVKLPPKTMSDPESSLNAVAIIEHIMLTNETPEDSLVLDVLQTPWRFYTLRMLSTTSDGKMLRENIDQQLKKIIANRDLRTKARQFWVQTISG